MAGVAASDAAAVEASGCTSTARSVQVQFTLEHAVGEGRRFTKPLQRYPCNSTTGGLAEWSS